MEAVKTNKSNTKKEAMIEALEKSLGIVSTAAKMVGIASRINSSMRLAGRVIASSAKAFKAAIITGIRMRM